MRATPFLRQNVPSVSAALRERVRRPALLKKLAHPSDLVQQFKVLVDIDTFLDIFLYLYT
jgi:hypothetical protein